jgi:hypothetical protein
MRRETRISADALISDDKLLGCLIKMTNTNKLPVKYFVPQNLRAIKDAEMR